MYLPTHLPCRYYLLVVHPQIQPWSGLVFSVTTNIHPSHLGLGPDPLAGPSFGLGLGSVNQPPPATDLPDPEGVGGAVFSYPAAILEFLSARASNLAAKLGYIRQRPPTDEAKSGGEVGEGETLLEGENLREEETLEEGFQCMKSLDEPVVVEGQPVLVAQPEDCHQGGSHQHCI
jgi:hypothetical protein